MAKELKDKLAGRFLVLDGPDGCGKSTQAGLLAEALGKIGAEVARFRDPGATAIGEKIRQILLNPEHAAMDVRSELLLYMAARAQLWAECIGPGLADGKCVILDRWLSSTCAYQGFAGGFGVANVIRLAEGCLERVWPDLTIILDVGLDISSKRMGDELDRMEQKGQEYHQKVRDGFLELAEQREDFTVVDGSGDIEAVHKEVLEIIRQADFI